jgi:Ca2+-binding EF-hand superfamily protein
VISIETQIANMGIRKRSILTALAIMLIAATPAWSQSLPKTLDPDNDGTVDLAEAKSKDEFLALVEKRFKAADPDNDGTIDAKELKSAAGRSLVILLK